MRKPTVIGIISIAVLIGAAGCAGVNPQVVNGEFEKLLKEREGEYHLKPGDEISVRVVGNEDFSREKVLVAQDGFISTPLGRFFVSGKTLREVQELIRREQVEFPTAPPPIVVELVNQAPKIVYVGGEVKNPGVVKLLPGMSALEAVMEVGGNKPSGKLRSIILIRRTENWKRVVRRVDLKMLEEDLVLMPRDIVYVPRTVVANIATFLDQYVTRVVPFNQYALAAALGIISY